MAIDIGSEAPDFTLPATRVGTFSLGAQRGRHNVVVIFYPKDNTPG